MRHDFETVLKWQRKGDQWVGTGTRGEYRIVTSVLPGGFDNFVAQNPDGQLACVDKLATAKAWCETHAANAYRKPR